MRFNPDEYVTVNQRIEKFYAKFVHGRILTSVVEHIADTGFILMRAEVYRNAEDELPASTGHAYEVKGGSGPQATSYIEVCETSAVGRALALLGFEVKKAGASREEVEKASRQPAAPQKTGKYDADILTARELLGKSHEDITKYVSTKFGGQEPWHSRLDEEKKWLCNFLQRKVDELAAVR
jgi:hypothetical protein